MSWPEASVGLVPGGLAFLVFHLLHVRKLGQAGKRKQAAVWWSLATVFLLGLGALMVVGGGEKVSDAKSELRSARAERSRSLANPYAYGSSYDSTSLMERDVEHYETAVAAGWGLLGLSLLFMIGTGIAWSSARKESQLSAFTQQPQPMSPA
jgi:hypothetical protein